MDAVQSSRWDDTFVSTVLGIVHGGEWSGILAANPYHRFAQRSVTAGATGLFAYTDLDSGTGDSAQTHHRILAITDGNGRVYRETSFREVPLATSSQSGQSIDGLWYDAGTNVQVLPPSGIALTVTINHTPPIISALSADSVTPEFPAGHEDILWLEAAAYLLSKGGAENEAAQTMRAMAEVSRQNMYSDLARRAAGPVHLMFQDRAADWGG